jgi:hypothetical protein
MGASCCNGTMRMTVTKQFFSTPCPGIVVKLKIGSGVPRKATTPTMAIAEVVEANRRAWYTFRRLDRPIVLR